MKKLRKVIDLVDVFEPEDHNDHVDNWKEQDDTNKSLRDLLNALLEKAGLGPDPALDDLISELQSIIAQMRYVKHGDFYYAKDHNLFVDAWNKQQAINSEIASKLAELEVVCVPLINEEAWVESEMAEELVTMGEEATITTTG